MSLPFVFQATIDKQQHTRTRGRPALSKGTSSSGIICFLNRLSALFFHSELKKKHEAQPHNSSVTFWFSAACLPQSEFFHSRTRQWAATLFAVDLNKSSFVFQNNRTYLSERPSPALFQREAELMCVIRRFCEKPHPSACRDKETVTFKSIES